MSSPNLLLLFVALDRRSDCWENLTYSTGCPKKAHFQNAFEKQFFETDTETFFRPKFSRPIPILFLRPNIFETNTETFFETLMN